MRALTLYILLYIISFPTLQIQGQDFNIRWFNTENGLPANGVKGIQWDPETEFAWIATEAGIVRFNGTEFSVYTRNNTPFLFSERIYFIAKNDKGRIYLADNKGNALTVESNRLAPYHTIKNKSKQNDKSLYGLTVSEEYFKFLQTHPSEQEFYIPFDKIVTRGDTSIFIVHSGKLFLKTIKDNKTQEIEGTRGNLKSIFRVGPHIYLLDSQNIISQFFPNALQARPVNGRLEGFSGLTNFPSKAELYWENGQANPILIVGNRAWELEETDDGLEGTLICKQVPTDAWIRNFLYVKELGLILIGTDSKGIAVLQRNSVTPVRYNKPSNRESNSYYSQIELPDGSILTNHGHRIGAVINPKLPLPIIGSFGNTVYNTDDSLLWYQQHNPETNKGAIYSYNYKTQERESQDIQFLGNTFGVWNQDNSTILISDQQIKQVKPEKKVLLDLADVNAFNSDPITTLPLDNNKIAIASCNGLVFFDRVSNTVDTILSLPNYCVRSLARFGNFLLIGTYGGGIYLHKLGGKTVKVPQDKKHSTQYSHCFMTDAYGFCWISTNRGLLKVQVKDLLGTYDNPDREIYYHYYGIADGMITSEMNGGCYPCALALKNGSFSFPTMDGLLWVDPANSRAPSNSGQLFIDEISFNDTTLKGPLPKQINLPANTRQLVVRLAYAAWSSRENIYLYYRIQAGDPWKEVPYANPSLIEINNLDPGKYELQIRKLNGFGESNYTLLTLPFVIDTPWYKMWWFYLIMTAVIYGATLLVFSIRTKNLQQNEKKLKRMVEENTLELKSQNQILEKNNRIMSRLISIISHDIVTPLKFIQVAGRNLLKKKEGISEELNRETITEITHTAQELQELSTNILNWIRFQRKNRLLQQVDFEPHEIAEQVIRILGPSAKLKEIAIRNLIEPGISIHQYAEPFRILLHNLISNAINFSEKGIIKVELSRIQNAFKLTVTDQGVGMTAEQIQNVLQEEMIISSATVDNRKGHGLGYQIIKDLSSLIEASVEIQSQRGVGTAVQITFTSSA